METEPLNSFLFKHTSVMTDEIINSIELYEQNSAQEFIGIDATLGGGGHSYELLKKYPNLQIIGLDQDPCAIENAKAKTKDFKNRIKIKYLNFCDFKPTCKVSFIIADLGVNSNQIDNPDRGFSFQKDGPIDMRMNPNLEINAAKLIKELNEKELADLIYKYGEERLSRKIAKRIKRDLEEKGNYKGTRELAYAISGCFPPKLRYRRIHPATRTFQALRIAVNEEIEKLDNFLKISPDWLLPNGIISIISFHSIEDRKIKYQFKNDERLVNLTRKPITPKNEEIASNKRSRSAKLRIAKLR